MSKYSGRGLLASFENEEDTVDAAPMVEDADNAEAALADAGEVQADINEAEGVVDQAIEDSETLETVASQLESREQSGGATPEEAEMAEITVESICNRLGIARNPMQSMESFSSRSSRVRATRLSVEGIREVGDTIWKYIVKIYKKIKEWVLKAWDYLFDARTKLLRRAKALEARVEKVEGTPKESVIQGGFIKDLMVGTAFKGVANTDKALGEAVKKVKDAAAVRVGDMAAAIADAAGTGAANSTDRIIDVVQKEVDKLAGAVSTKGVGADVVSKSKSSKEYKVMFAPLGGEVPVVTIPESGAAKGIDLLKLYKKAKVTTEKSYDKVNENFKAPVLKETEMIGAVGKVIAALEEMEDVKKDVNKFRDELEKAIKKLDSVGQAPTKDDSSKEVNKVAKEAGQVVAVLPRVVSGAITNGSKVILSYCRAVLDYVQKSASQYKVENDDEE